MNYIGIFISIVLTFTLQTPVSKGDDVRQKVSTALRNGDAKELGECFNDNIRLKIQKNDHIYSRNQAGVIMENFFAGNKPTNYFITSIRKSGSSTIIVGSLETSQNLFRIYYQLSDSSIPQKINYLDIQKMEI